MKYSNKREQYEISNCTLNLNKCVGYSYGWYQIARKIGNTWVLNTYNYSNTTIQQYNKMRRFMRDELNIIPLEIQAPKGLQDLNEAIRHIEGKIAILQHEIEKPRSQPKKNESRLSEISMLESEIGIILILMKQEKRLAA